MNYIRIFRRTNQIPQYLYDSARKSISRATEDEYIKAFPFKYNYYDYNGSVESFNNTFLKSIEDSKYEQIQKYMLAIKHVAPEVGIMYQPAILVRRSLNDIAYYKNRSEYLNKTEKLFMYDIPYMRKEETYFEYERLLSKMLNK